MAHELSDENQSKSPKRINRWLAGFLLFIMGATWGLQFALLKLSAVEGFNEFGILALSLLTLAPLYGAALIWRKELFRPTRRHLFFFFMSGSLGYVVPLGAAVHAAVHLQAGLIALIASLTPVVTVVTALLLRTERVSALRIAAVFFGIAAALVVLWSDLGLPGESAYFWVLIAFVAPLAYGFDGVYVGAFWPDDLNTLQVVAGEALIAGLAVLPIYLLSGHYISFSGPWTPGHLGIAGFVAVSLIEVFLFFYLIRTAGAVLVSFGSFIALIAGIFWGWIIFNEALTQGIWIAAGLLALALVCVSLGSNDQSTE